ncbi:Proteasome subunit beta type-9 [Nesidiocoris tenuis]|uniref:Proteasome subunit beta n=1 Tax=Nesidiocoris tenuis TaxID=355587 RepID=A0ABN7AV49_9HEMI|nr:Proteasome subunit beta type-9 [Nesidiocoris tenuis]
METILGLRTDNFCILASDMTAAHSIIVMKSNEKKIYPVSDQILMAATGQQGDAHQFAEYIVKNVQLYKMRNGYGLSTASAAHFIRQNLAEYLRSQTPYNVNLLLGGFEEKTGGQLYYMDYLASSHEVKYGSHGYGGVIALSILERYWRPDMTEAEAYDIMIKCVEEIQRRLIINLPNFHIQIVDKNGIRVLPDITTATVLSKKSQA